MQKIRDEWFSKPHFFQTFGRWYCGSYRADAWYVCGLGNTPSEALADMKARIVRLYDHGRFPSQVEFA